MYVCNVCNVYVYLIQPIFSPVTLEESLPLSQRYSFLANVWIAIFSFIGNYWYTHYFFVVLKAKYTFPAHLLNGVVNIENSLFIVLLIILFTIIFFLKPIALFFATHFYFMFYHTISNIILRSIETRYTPGTYRSILFWTTIFGFSYFTAFGEVKIILNIISKAIIYYDNLYYI